jgi:hypothetical protein
LSALHSITIGGGTVVGGINAGGCGGTAGIMYNAGGGGGAGGAIFIESPMVNLMSNGTLAANGGGGGSYGGSFTTGQPGALDANFPQGAPGSSGAGYAGAGYGGAATTLTGGQGYSATCSGCEAGGGGGGAAGVIVIANLSGSLTPPAGVVISPTLATKNHSNQTISGITTVTIK